jgi:hypothetical protein
MLLIDPELQGAVTSPVLDAKEITVTPLDTGSSDCLEEEATDGLSTFRHEEALSLQDDADGEVWAVERLMAKSRG